MMFLDLMPVVEKPEIVQANEQKLKSLCKKYVVKLSTFYTINLTFRDVLSVKPKIAVLFLSVVLQSTSKNAKMAAVLQVQIHLI